MLDTIIQRLEPAAEDTSVRRLAGLQAPHIGSQFTDEADVYATRYDFRQAMLLHIGAGLDAAGIDRAAPLKVLDIGCGAGNATIALAELLPDADILATDLSVQLLALLEERARELRLATRISLVAADASTIQFRPGSFDLICGSSMLHHLLDPEEAVTRWLGSSLKETGSAMFFEPFHSGAYVLRQAMIGLRHLRNAGVDINGEIASCLDQFVFGIDYVTDPHRPTADKAKLDDKWLFTRELFERIARRTGKRLTIYATNPEAEPVSEKITNMLRSVGITPKWSDAAMAFLTDFDRGRTAELRKEFMTEGAIIFTPKPE